MYEPAPNPVREYWPAVAPSPPVVVETVGEPAVLWTRTFETYRGAGGLPSALPYVIVPLIVGGAVGVGVAVLVAVDVGVLVAVEVFVAVAVGVKVGVAAVIVIFPLVSAAGGSPSFQLKPGWNKLPGSV